MSTSRHYDEDFFDASEEGSSAGDPLFILMCLEGDDIEAEEASRHTNAVSIDKLWRASTKGTTRGEW